MIYQGRKQKTKDRKVRLIFTNNEANPPIHKWLREGKKFLRTEKAKKMGDNLQVVYKQPKNLQRMLGGNKKKENRPPVQGKGSDKCNHCRVACPVVKEASRFRRTNTTNGF